MVRGYIDLNNPLNIEDRSFTFSRAKVQLLISDYALETTAQNFNSVQRLSDLATTIFDDAVSTRNLACGHDATCESKLLMLVHDTLYHQCQITLHSMVVPLFSGVPIDSTIDLETQKESAETVTRHADLFENLLTTYLRDESDVTRIPPLVGYGAFITGVVFLATEISCQDKGLHGTSIKADTTNRRLTAAKAILHILDALRVYWRALQHPVS